ncbi:MAG: FecR domain-containing protein [Lachnospiraceae bacterium]|nr:FecR domain-containing protein [Lachnospiraceae bacterium]
MKKRILSLVLIVSLMCLTLSGCGRIKATTMRILGYEGKITMEEDGKNKNIKENLRINSGNTIKTSIFSSANIGLDDVKLVSMDQESIAEFVQEGKYLEMTLTKGSIFFEVKKPLEEDETFNIKTSTMIAGIRGTSGYVEVNEDGTERLIVTDGVVHVIYTNPQTGETSEADVRAGEEFRTYPGRVDNSNDENNDDGDHADDTEGDEGDDGQNADLENGGNMYEATGVDPETFPAFARNYILANEEVKEKISDDMGEDELDEILWDEEIGYQPSQNSYGSYGDMGGVIGALEQLEMVFRIAAYSINRDAEGLEQYLESMNVPGAEYISEFGMRMLESMTAGNK